MSLVYAVLVYAGDPPSSGMAQRRHSWSLAHSGSSPSTEPGSGVLSKCLPSGVSVGWQPSSGKAVGFSPVKEASIFLPFTTG